MNTSGKCKPGNKNRKNRIPKIQIGKLTNRKYISENTTRKIQVDQIQIGKYKSEITNRKIQLGE